MAWMPRVWFRRLNTGACPTDTHAGVSCPVFLYHRWREIDTCQVCFVSSCIRGGEVQPRSDFFYPWLNKITWRAMSDTDVSAVGALTKKTPVHFDSAPVGCFSSLALLPIEKASRYRTKIKRLRQDQGGRYVYRVSLSGRNATLTSKWVSTSWSA